MEEKRKISINETPVWFKAIIALFPLFFIAMIKFRLDNDFYFIYPTGEYIVNNGFPVKDFLSMHSDMSIICQQWLSAVIYYFAYKSFGLIGAVGIVYICYISFVILMNRLCFIVTNNFFVASLCAAAADFFIASGFSTTRPQVFTYVIMLVELLALEKFVKTKKIKHLFIIPVLSLLLINMHCSMWMMLFVFMLPYFAGAIKLDIPKLKIKQVPCCSFVALFVTAVISAAVGFINPYGIKAMTYIFTSFGYDEISNNIHEMTPPSYSNDFGRTFFIYLAVMAFISLLYKNKKFSTRFALLFAGTVVLAFTSQKSIAYFLIAGTPAFAYMLSDFDFKLTMTDTVSQKDKKTRKILVSLIAVMLVACVGVFIATDKPETEEDIVKKYEYIYSELDEAIDIIKASDEEVTLYGGFNVGQYLEFNGLHPYMDGRAELYLKDNNGSFDYLKEYYELKNGDIDYTDFIDKYGFNYFVIQKKNETYFAQALEHDNNYEKLYDGKYIMLCHLKG